jgi:hypothetical protein
VTKSTLDENRLDLVNDMVLDCRRYDEKEVGKRVCGKRDNDRKAKFVQRKIKREVLLKNLLQYERSGFGRIETRIYKCVSGVRSSPGI